VKSNLRRVIENPPLKNEPKLNFKLTFNFEYAGKNLQLTLKTETHRSSAGSGIATKCNFRESHVIIIIMWLFLIGCRVVLVVLLQMGLSDIHSDAVLDLLVQIFEEPYFDQLRTKECLGYNVSVNTRRSRGTNGILYMVQGATHPTFVESRIESFINTMTV